MNSSFYAYLSRLRWIIRWGLMRNAYPENVMEHSWEVAVIAHALALIKNRYFDGNVDANAVATAALFHDASEVMTGDLPTPVKYHSEAIQQAYKTIERQAGIELLQLLPDDLQEDYRLLIGGAELPEDQLGIVKAADKIAGYLKCQAELQAGNREFEAAAEDIADTIRHSELPEVEFFMRVFAPSYGLSLDRLVKRNQG